MGTRKGTDAGTALSATAVKYRSTLNAKKANPISRPKKLHRRQKFTKDWFTKEWEQWEDQLVIALGKEGKSNEYTSQQLPGRTIAACATRRSRLKAQSQMFSAKQKDALAPTGNHFPQKEWEEWEDRIIVTHRSAGESWGRISKLLPLRTTCSVLDRWKRANLFLESQPQESVDPTQSSNTLSVTRPARHLVRWEEGEEQLLTSLRTSGKGFAEIAKQFPNRSAMCCEKYWYQNLYGTQGQSTPKSARQSKEWEERLLFSGHYAGLSWKEISRSITARTISACKNQWKRFFASPDQDGSWTPEELTLLTHLRSEGNNWNEISQELPGHTSNACRTQWYRETEGIQGPNFRVRKYDTWTAQEVEILVALYNTIGPRWQEISKHIPNRTARACERFLNCIRTKEDGVGGPPSKFWKEFFMSKLHARNCYSPRCSKLIW